MKKVYEDLTMDVYFFSTQDVLTFSKENEWDDAVDDIFVPNK